MKAEAPPPLRVTVQCSFTLDLVRRYLSPALASRGIPAETRLSEYGQWETDIFDERSELYQFGPDVVFLFADAEDLIPQLTPDTPLVEASEAEAVGHAAWLRVAALVRLLFERLPSHAVVFCHNLAPLPGGPLGLLEGNSGLSHCAASEVFNRELRAAAAAEPRLFVVDYASLILRHGASSWFDVRLWHLGRMRVSRHALPLLSDAYARYLAALRVPRRKCLVLDLDNTLWGGVVGENGLAGIEIGHTGLGLAYREFQMMVLALQRRGVVLAICSKNNEADAMEALQEHPEMLLRPEHLSCWAIDWDPKPNNLRRIAGQLNIGVESLVFWDDSPLERGLVRSQLPEVFVPEVPEDPSDYARFLCDMECFDVLHITEEDRQRGRLYREQTQRESIRERYSSISLEGYYQSLSITATIGLATDVDVPRLSQLTQRTNQFNLTTRRYTEADIRQRLTTSTEWRVYTLQAKDRFGELGLVGGAMIRVSPDAWEIDTFLMSCRALGRQIEDAFLSRIAQDAAVSDVRLEGEFVPTAKNTPSRQFLERIGLLVSGSTPPNGGRRFVLPKNGVVSPDWIVVHAKQEE